MRSRILVTLAAVWLATGALAQERPEGKGRGGPPGGFGGRMFGGGGGGGFGFSRLSLLRIPQVQKELDLVDEQLTAIQKLQEEMGGFGGRGGPGGGDEKGGRGRGRPEGTKSGNGASGNGAALEQRAPASWYFVQAQEQQNQRRFGQGGGGQPPTDEERAQQEQQRLERARQEKAKLGEILLPHQMQRLTEIFIQVAGAAALQDEDIAKELGISDAQKTQIATIREASREAMRGLFGPPGGGQPGEGDREAMMARFREAQAKMDDARKAGDAKILAVLTAEQKAKFDEMKGEKLDLPEEALRPPGFGGFGGRGPGGPGDGKRGPRPNN